MQNEQRIVTRNGHRGRYIGQDPGSQGRRHWVLLGTNTNPTFINSENLFTDEQWLEREMKKFGNEDLLAEVARRNIFPFGERS
jgi:hypothetical protein